MVLKKFPRSAGPITESMKDEVYNSSADFFPISPECAEIQSNDTLWADAVKYGGQRLGKV